MVLLTHRRSNCLVIRGQIFFREKKGVLERKRAREDDYDMIRRNEILTRSLPGLRLQIRRLPPQTPPPYTALAKSKRSGGWTQYIVGPAALIETGKSQVCPAQDAGLPSVRPFSAPCTMFIMETQKSQK